MGTSFSDKASWQSVSGFGGAAANQWPIRSRSEHVANTSAGKGPWSGCGHVGFWGAVDTLNFEQTQDKVLVIPLPSIVYTFVLHLSKSLNPSIMHIQILFAHYRGHKWMGYPFLHARHRRSSPGKGWPLRWSLDARERWTLGDFWVASGKLT